MEEHTGTGFLPLLLVLLLAFFVPMMLSRFKRVPVVVGEIVALVKIGKQRKRIEKLEDEAGITKKE